MNIISVYKTGGDFDREYVDRLYNGLRNNIEQDFNFICLTDSDEDIIGKRPLLDGLRGWWSKIELFKNKGKYLFFDLDTVIWDDIEILLDNLKKVNDKKLFMLDRFIPVNLKYYWNSGIMAWNGDWTEIYKYFQLRDMNTFRGDQDYLNHYMQSTHQEIFRVNDLCDYIYSYKHHCRNAIPEDAKIICFHGNPRPRKVNWLELA